MPGFFSRFLRTTDAVEGACRSDPRKLAPPRPPLCCSTDSFALRNQLLLQTTDFLLLKLLKSWFLCLQDLFFLQRSVRMFALRALFFFLLLGWVHVRATVLYNNMCVSRRALQFVATCLSCCQSLSEALTSNKAKWNVQRQVLKSHRFILCKSCLKVLFY